jgi:hypothetical protein
MKLVARGTAAFASSNALCPCGLTTMSSTVMRNLVKKIAFIIDWNEMDSWIVPCARNPGACSTALRSGLPMEIALNSSVIRSLSMNKALLEPVKIFGEQVMINDSRNTTKSLLNGRAGRVIVD